MAGKNRGWCRTDSAGFFYNKICNKIRLQVYNFNVLHYNGSGRVCLLVYPPPLFSIIRFLIWAISPQQFSISTYKPMLKKYLPSWITLLRNNKCPGRQPGAENKHLKLFPQGRIPGISFQK